MHIFQLRWDAKASTNVVHEYPHALFFANSIMILILRENLGRRVIANHSRYAARQVEEAVCIRIPGLLVYTIFRASDSQY